MKTNCLKCKKNTKEKEIDYIGRMGEKTIIIKRTPAKICENCYEEFFDNNTVEKIEKIKEELKKLSNRIIIVDYYSFFKSTKKERLNSSTIIIN